MDEYLKTLLEQIRCKKARPYVKQEFQDHIEDQIEANMQAGMDREQAEREAVRDMGDPVETGISLDSVRTGRSVLTDFSGNPCMYQNACNADKNDYSQKFQCNLRPVDTVKRDSCFHRISHIPDSFPLCLFTIHACLHICLDLIFYMILKFAVRKRGLM